VLCTLLSFSTLTTKTNLNNRVSQRTYYPVRTFSTLKIPTKTQFYNTKSGFKILRKIFSN